MLSKKWFCSHIVRMLHRLQLRLTHSLLHKLSTSTRSKKYQLFNMLHLKRIKHVSLLLLMLTLYGCTSIPQQKVLFPVPPVTLMQSPPLLNELSTEPLTLTGIVQSTADNYLIANRTRIQLLLLQSWITDQSNLSNSVK